MTDTLNKQIANILNEYCAATNVSDGKGGVYYDFEFEEATQALTSLLSDQVIEADRKTLETLYAILNGDDNQVNTAKAYIWNRLRIIHDKRGDK